MDELVSLSIQIHIFFLFLTLLFAIVSFFVVKSSKEYINMTKKFEFFTPLYYLNLSIVIFTGFVILAVFKFHTNYSVYFMLLSSIAIIIGAFKVYKLFKKTRVKDINSQELFRQFAIKKYLFDIVIILITAIFGFVLS